MTHRQTLALASLGAAVIAVGLALVWVPVGVIFAGISILSIALLVDYRR